MADDYKSCRICDKRKPLASFPRHPTCADGHDTRCRLCAREIHRRYRAEKKAREAREPKALARPPGSVPIQKFDTEETCADCGVELTRNRRVIIAGEHLCLACRKARFE